MRAVFFLIVPLTILTQPTSSDEAELESFREYCNTRGVTPGAEGSFRPAGFTLDKVIVIARHGDRFTMADTRLGRLEAPRVSCKRAGDATAAYAGGDASLLTAYTAAATALTPIEDGDGGFWLYPPYPDAPLCGHTHLTVSGVEQHLRLGAYLKRAYAGQFGDRWLADSACTDYRRTYQSTLALLYALGVAGEHSQASRRLQKLVIRKVSARHQNLCAVTAARRDCHCPALDVLRGRVNAEMASTAKHSDAAHAEFTRLARRILGPRGKPDYPWKAAHDFLMQFACRDLPLPCYRTRCFRRSHLDSLWRHLNHYFSALSVLPAFVRRSRIEMQPLLEDLALALNESSPAADAAGLLVYVGHDSTIVPLAVSLGLPVARWPPYAARFVIELYSRTDDAAPMSPASQTQRRRQRMLRFLYEGRDVTAAVGVCRRPANAAVADALADGDGEGLCPVERLLDFVKDDLKELGFKDWRAACDATERDLMAGLD